MEKEPAHTCSRMEGDPSGKLESLGSQAELYKSALTDHERHKMKSHGVLRDGLACKVPESHRQHACEKACHHEGADL